MNPLAWLEGLSAFKTTESNKTNAVSIQGCPPFCPVPGVVKCDCAVQSYYKQH